MAKPKQPISIIAAGVVFVLLGLAGAAAPAHAAFSCPGEPPPGQEGAFRRGTKQVIAANEVGVGLCGAELQVINGKPTTYKHVVGISYKSPEGADSICTGTLLSKRLVLTAAHCGCGSEYRITQQPEITQGPFIAIAGRPILFDPYKCQRREILPGYDLALLKLARDADVLTLEQKEKLSGRDTTTGDLNILVDPKTGELIHAKTGEKLIVEYNPPFKLASFVREATRVNAKLTVMGYGRTETGGRGRRMEAQVPVFTPDCSKAREMAMGCAPFLEMILSSTARTDDAPPTDTCNGDSGGPVFAMREENEQAIPILFAVTSRPAPLPHTDLVNHCGGGSINVVFGRKDVLFWLFQNGLSTAFADPLE